MLLENIKQLQNCSNITLTVNLAVPHPGVLTNGEISS